MSPFRSVNGGGSQTSEMVDESKVETLSCVGAAVGAAGAQYTTANHMQQKQRSSGVPAGNV